MKRKITVVIPAYNEAARIGATLRTLVSLELFDQFIVVNDGSTDHTDQVVNSFPQVTQLIHLTNQGKAGALHTGTQEALKQGEIILYLDADLGESAGEAVKLVEPILTERAQVTVGRFPSGNGKGGFGLVKGLVAWGQQLHAGGFIESALSGQRAMTREVCSRLRFPAHGYGVELATTIDLLKAGIIPLEVPVAMGHRETGRDLAGFLHRGKQFSHIFQTLLVKKFQ